MLDSLSNTLSTLEAENCQLAKHAEAEPKKGGCLQKKMCIAFVILRLCLRRSNVRMWLVAGTKPMKSPRAMTSMLSRGDSDQ